MDITIKDCTDSIGAFVKNLTQETMQDIVKEKGNSVELKASILGSNVFILRYLLSEILDFKSYSIGYSLINPNATYEDLYNDKNLTFKNNSEYGVYAISLNRSSIWQEKFYTNSSSGDEFLRATAQLDRFFYSLVKPDGMKYFKRFNFYYIEGNTQMLRTYPAEKIQNANLSLNKSNTLYEYYYEYALALLQNTSDLPYVYLNGPYKDLKTFGNPMCSMNAFLKINGTFRGVIQLELQKKFFDDYTANLKFLETGYGMLFNVFGIVIGRPFSWEEFSDNQLIKMTDIPNRTDLNEQEWQKLYNLKDNDKTLREITILDFYYNYGSFYESTALLPYDIKQSKFGKWEFGFKLYVEQKEIDSIEDHLRLLMSRNSETIHFLAFVFCSFTIGIVIVFSFKVTMGISKPLKAMIRIADLINNRITEEQVLKEARDEIKNLPEGEFQLRHLIVAFKDFMGVVGHQKRAKETKILNKPVFYPLNQYHQNYVQKAKKGISEINWRLTLEQIINEIDEDSMEMDLESNE